MFYTDRHLGCRTIFDIVDRNTTSAPDRGPAVRSLDVQVIPMRNARNFVSSKNGIFGSRLRWAWGPSLGFDG
jgi:hypothetical protein